MKQLAVYIITFYQYFLSFDKGILRVFAPGGACRYNVSCSEYVKQAILEYGLFKGLSLGVKRLLSCNPISEAFKLRL